MFNINAKEVVAYTNKLERLHRSALPVSIRGALNEAAFQSKTKYVPEIFDRNFIERKKNFIRSHSAFNRSPNTFDVKKMVSEVGIIKGKSTSGDELVNQEFGGTIRNREFIPMDPARVGNNKLKLVSKKFYLKNIKPKRDKMRTKDQEFIRAAFKAGKGGFVRYDDLLFEIKTIKKQKGDKLFIKANPIYSFKENRSVTIKKMPFLLPAAQKAALKIPEYYIQQAERRLNK